MSPQEEGLTKELPKCPVQATTTAGERFRTGPPQTVHGNGNDGGDDDDKMIGTGHSDDSSSDGSIGVSVGNLRPALQRQAGRRHVMTSSVVHPKGGLGNIALTCIIINYISAGYILLPSGESTCGWGRGFPRN